MYISSIYLREGKVVIVLSPLFLFYMHSTLASADLRKGGGGVGVG